jgi:hypothetical protein
MKIFELISEIFVLCFVIMIFILGLLIIWDGNWNWNATSLGGGISIFSLLCYYILYVGYKRNFNKKD